MAYSPISFIAPNYRDFKTDWLKAYEPGTTTPKTISLNSDGSALAIKVQLNADGFPVSAGGAIVIPHLNGAYDLWLFPTEAEADANDTTNALRVADNITADGSSGSGANFVEENITLTAGQTTVVFTSISAARASIYIGSATVDRGRLIKNIDYTVTAESTIELSSSFPAGSFCVGVSDEVAAGETTLFVRKYLLLDDAVNDASLNLNDVIVTNDRNGATFDVVLLSSVTANTFNIVECIGVNTLALSLRVNSAIHSKQFGLVGDGVADDTVAISELREYMVLNPEVELVFDEGTYLYSTSPNWAIAKLVVRALGIVTFRNTGTGDCLIFDDPVSTTFNITWCWDNPIFIEGDDDTGHGLYNRSVHHSQIAVNIRGCGGNVQRSEFAVVDEFRITASINQGAWYSATAPDGISLTSNGDITKETSACIWYNPIIEGVRGVGISLDRAINNQFILGTSEGNVGANVECLQNSRNNKFDGIDLEASGSSQGFIDRGRWNRWIGIFNDANSTITSDAVGSAIRDGIHDAIINDGAYTSIENVNYGAGTGEITDTGTFTTITDAYDLESASIKIPNKVQGKTKFTTTLTVGAFGVTALVPGNLTKSAVILANVKIGDNVDLSSLTAVSSEFTKPTAICIVDGQIDITFSQLNGVAASPLPAGGDFTITVNGK